jgi:hypothetical protein
MKTRSTHLVIGCVDHRQPGLPQEAVPVCRLEPGAVSCLAFDVRFWHLADMHAASENVCSWG